MRRALSSYLPPRQLPVLALVFVAVIVFFYGGWPLDPTRGFGALIDGLTFWLSEGQQEEGTVTYYLRWIVSGTPVLFALAVLGSLGAVLRPDSEWIRWLFLAWAAPVTLVLSLIGDQSWWNVVLLFPPIALLAGYGVADLWRWTTWLTEAVDERTDRFDARRVGRPAIPSSTGRVLGSVVLPVALAVLVLAVVTGAVATPETVAGLDHPNRTTTFGIEGVTVPDRRDARDEAFRAAREAAIETRCPGIIGPGVYEWPGRWWFRGVEHSRLTDIKERHLPAVVLTGNEYPTLDERNYRVLEFDRHRVYVPPDPCSNAG